MSGERVGEIAEIETRGMESLAEAPKR